MTFKYEMINADTQAINSVFFILLADISRVIFFTSQRREKFSSINIVHRWSDMFFSCSISTV